MKVRFLPQNIIQEANVGETLLEVAIKAGVNINGSCNGEGTCGKCKVRIVGEEPISNLACQKRVAEDMTVMVSESQPIASRKGRSINLPEDFQPDLIQIEDGNEETLGIAVDIGTTTVVIMLWDLHRGQLIDVFATTNPQSAYGADVITRISFAMEEKRNLRLLQKAIIDCINKAIDYFCHHNKINNKDIYRLVAVGNTTMNHLFLGVDPFGLAKAPFKPKVEGSKDCNAVDLAINMNPQGKVHCVSGIAGHVGSDITAGILTTDLMSCDKGHLFIDIGTNGEIVLTGNGRAVTCSTAAGPAFEGSSIAQGMRASTGAIERVKISIGDVEISVIGDTNPCGICGSGIIDAVGQLLKIGIIDRTGRILDPEMMRGKGIQQNVLEHLRESKHGNEFVLFFGGKGEEDVAITQKDVREIQLAKAAISAGITVLMKEIGISEDGLEKISVAGAFGNYICKYNAMEMGLIPRINAEKVCSLGNCAGVGASMVLLSEKAERQGDEAACRIEHIQLAETPNFSEEYMKSMNF